MHFFLIEQYYASFQKREEGIEKRVDREVEWEIWVDENKEQQKQEETKEHSNYRKDKQWRQEVSQNSWR